MALISSCGTQKAGEYYYLACQFTGGGTVTSISYQWFKNDMPLLNEASATLSFSPLKENDSGVYTCEVNQNAMSEGITVSVLGK
jgi:hypothetical protein